MLCFFSSIFFLHILKKKLQPSIFMKLSGLTQDTICKKVLDNYFYWSSLPFFEILKILCFCFFTIFLKKSIKDRAFKFSVMVDSVLSQ